MNMLDRRTFLKTSLLAGAAASLPGAHLHAQTPGAVPRLEAPGIVDTNINLFDWPFRKLKYRDTASLVAKLKKHRIIEAWAGSFEALLHKNITGVNERLTRECREHGDRKSVV